MSRSLTVILLVCFSLSSLLAMPRRGPFDPDSDELDKITPESASPGVYLENPICSTPQPAAATLEPQGHAFDPQPSSISLPQAPSTPHSYLTPSPWVAENVAAVEPLSFSALQRQGLELKNYLFSLRFSYAIQSLHLVLRRHNIHPHRLLTSTDMESFVRYLTEMQSFWGPNLPHFVTAIALIQDYHSDPALAKKILNILISALALLSSQVIDHPI